MQASIQQPHRLELNGGTKYLVAPVDEVSLQRFVWRDGTSSGCVQSWYGENVVVIAGVGISVGQRAELYMYLDSIN